MVSYIMRRLLWMVPTLLAMALITFTIMHLTPGSPLDPVADNTNPLGPEAQRNMEKQYGLDKPLWQQFVIFLAKAVRGDCGTSYVYKNRAVHEIIRQAFPVSLHLGGMALAVAFVGPPITQAFSMTSRTPRRSTRGRLKTWPNWELRRRTI